MFAPVYRLWHRTGETFHATVAHSVSPLLLPSSLDSAGENIIIVLEYALENFQITGVKLTEDEFVPQTRRISKEEL